MSASTPTNPATHEHSLKVFKPGRKPKNILRSLVGSLKYGKPDVSKLSSLAEDLDLKDSDGIFSEKYGVSREIIGSGGSSIVWLFDNRDSAVSDDNTLLAVKGYRPKSGSTEKEFKRRLQEEHDLLSSLHHPNVLRSLDLLQNEKGAVFEVLEFCAGGDLHSLIIERGKLDAAEADCFFKQIMSGVRYLHENGIAHRDLKPENLVLTAEGVVKIVDFGESERFRDAAGAESALSTEVVGTSPYISPESYSDAHFDAAAADVWATGVIYMVLRLGRYLWRKADDTDEFYEKYVRDRRTEQGYAHIEGLGREDRTSVIYTILDPRANRRLTASQFHLTQWARRIEVCKGVEQSLKTFS